ncbi:MAG TPA: glycosyltransferase [Lysobacter sp.]|nr:glycosyltransferase [Lysobacter sp.]
MTSVLTPDTLLVSGPNGGGLALIRAGRVVQVIADSATGIAVGAGRIAWCAQAAGDPSELRIVQGGSIVSMRVADDDLDLHDLVDDGDGWLAVATMRNAIVRIDADGVVAPIHEFPGEPDAMHLNSLGRHEGRLLASAFGRFQTHREYKGRSRGAGLVLDVASGDAVFEDLSQPHSLVSHEGSLYLCDSEASAVVRIEADGRETRVTLPGYTRGLCVSGDYVYVGLSRSRNQSERALERFPSAVVATLRRSDLTMLGHVALPWSEIYDVKAVVEERAMQALLMLALDHAQAEVAPTAAPLTVDSSIARRLAEVEAKLVSAISDDIRRMQHEHGDMLRASERLQAELDHERLRADRAERFGRWAAQAWGDAAEQRQAMEALTGAVIAMESRLSAAIGEDIRRMQEAYAALLESASRSAGELAALRLQSEEARTQRERADATERQRDELASAFAEFRQAAAAQDLVARDRLQVLEGELMLAEQRHRTMALEAEAQYAAEAAAVVAERDATVLEAQAQHAAQLAAVVAERDAAVLEAQAQHAAQLAVVAAERDALSERISALYRSTSWRLTRPFRFASRLARNGFGREERLLLADWLTRVRWLPLPARGRMTLAQRIRPPYNAHVEQLPSSIDLTVALPTLAPPGELEDVFVWGVIDWHFRTQRPQHLARALAAKGHRVFYMSNVFVDVPYPGFAVDDLDGSGRLMQVHLNVPGAPSIYASEPSEETLERLGASFRRVVDWAGTRNSVSIVQHPYWTVPAQYAPNARLVYDCMDHHAGFDNNTPAALASEHRLARRADLVVVTSTWLEDEMKARCDRVALVRNAADFGYFREPPTDRYRDPHGRRVIGYIGAIAEWFDPELVRAVAASHADCAVVLVGADTANVGGQLADLPNVVMVGEVPYSRLPFWLHGFDVCLLPFQVIPLTLATNPVKVYEYLSAGKAVVATDLPEMTQFDGLVEVATGAEEFADAVGRALASVGPDVEDARRAFASRQTWAHRAAELDAAIGAIEEPRISVVVLTYNNLDYTNACLFSLDAYTDYSNLEIIVVDNASSDGTPDYLREWVEQGDNRKIVLNDDNLGFAAGNNRGLDVATGDYLVVLNNDTYVTPGWLRTLVGHLRRDPSIGIIGPVTNNIGNEARIDIAYADMVEMIESAGRYTRSHAGQVMRLPVVAFFCAAMPRAVYQKVGGLDEAFGTGFFEDDDYCLRVREAGWDVACAEDVFVHHHLSASFDKLKAEQRQALFERNRAIYEAKWGRWTPHRYRA